MSEIPTMVRGNRTYRLIFEDTFSGDTLDTTKWELCPEGPRHDIGGQWANSEVSVHDGNLWLRARIREDGVPVSGGIRSLGKFEQLRGYFECRMMFPKTTDGKETWRTAGGGVCQHPAYLKLTTEFGSWAAPIVPEQLPDHCRVDWVRVWQEA